MNSAIRQEFCNKVTKGNSAENRSTSIAAMEPLIDRLVAEVEHPVMKVLKKTFFLDLVQANSNLVVWTMLTPI